VKPSRRRRDRTLWSRVTFFGQFARCLLGNVSVILHAPMLSRLKMVCLGNHAQPSGAIVAPVGGSNENTTSRQSQRGQGARRGSERGRSCAPPEYAADPRSEALVTRTKNRRLSPMPDVALIAPARNAWGPPWRRFQAPDPHSRLQNRGLKPGLALDPDAACEALETCLFLRGPKRTQVPKETQQSIPPPPNTRNAVARRAIRRFASLSGYSRHGAIFGAQRSAAIDPQQKSRLLAGPDISEQSF
jgi:hypothetical protein